MWLLLTLCSYSKKGNTRQFPVLWINLFLVFLDCCAQSWGHNSNTWEMHLMSHLWVTHLNLSLRAHAQMSQINIFIFKSCTKCAKNCCLSCFYDRWICFLSTFFSFLGLVKEEFLVPLWQKDEDHGTKHRQCFNSKLKCVLLRCASVFSTLTMKSLGLQMSHRRGRSLSEAFTLEQSEQGGLVVSSINSSDSANQGLREGTV